MGTGLVLPNGEPAIQPERRLEDERTTLRIFAANGDCRIVIDDVPVVIPHGKAWILVSEAALITLQVALEQTHTANGELTAALEKATKGRRRKPRLVPQTVGLPARPD